MSKKCAKCGKDLLYFTLVLMMGPRGFRRYPVCDKCEKKEEQKRKVENRKQVIEHG